VPSSPEHQEQKAGQAEQYRLCGQQSHRAAQVPCTADDRRRPSRQPSGTSDTSWLTMRKPSSPYSSLIVTLQPTVTAGGFATSFNPINTLIPRVVPPMQVGEGTGTVARLRYPSQLQPVESSRREPCTSPPALGEWEERFLATPPSMAAGVRSGLGDACQDMRRVNGRIGAFGYGTHTMYELRDKPSLPVQVFDRL
jgi:hypothetical protein